jgi:DNA-binding IclR family transcriptional regulator
VVAAISAAGPAFRMTGENLEHLMSRVPDLAAEYSKRLGYVPS